MIDHIIKAAKAAGGTTYTNRHHDGTACAFGPEALECFYAIAYRAGMERAAELCDGVYYKHIGPAYGEVRFGIAASAAAIRAEAHAQNQPKTTHDGSVV